MMYKAIQAGSADDSMQQPARPDAGGRCRSPLSNGWWNDWQPRVSRWARHFSGLADADDVMQETLIKIFLNREEIKQVNNLQAWIRRITYTTAKTAVRREQRHPTSVADPEFVAAAHRDPIETFCPFDKRDELIDRYEQETGGDASAVRHYYELESTAAAAAARSDISAGTLRQRLKRFRQWCKTQPEISRFFAD